MRYRAGDRTPDDYDYRPVRRGRAKGGLRARFGRARQSGSRPGQGRSAWRRKSRLARTGYVLATVFALVLVVAGLGGYAELRHLEGNITVVKVGGLTGRTIYGAQNILVLGSQIRAGQHGKFFGIAPGSSIYTSNSDNLLVVHLDPTHTHATILSIPRDTFVYEPGCKARNHFIGYGILGPYAYPPGNIIDGALNIGGPTCAVKTVEDLTGIKLDHFVEFNFNSFRRMVDALGGVEVCVPPGGYHDPASGVNLRPGKHLLHYNQALAYVRQRHNLKGPDAGGDLPRIELQQAFISSVVQKVNQQGLLSNLPALVRIADIATKALTVDRGLGSLTSLLHLARSLVHLKTRDVTLVTMPTTTDTYPGFSSHLMAVEPQDDVLFGMLIKGQNWHGHLPTKPPANVQVRVVNGTGRSGLAARTRAKLRKLGFDVIGIGTGTYTSTTTVSYAGIAQADAAYTVMTALTNFPAGQNLLVEPAPQLGTPGPVTLTLGADFAGVKAPAPQTGQSSTPGKTKSSDGKGGSSTVLGAGSQGPNAVQARNAAANICSGLPKG
ncbi:MAG: LCP family protein [Streptosporangiaceae bacterium]